MTFACGAGESMLPPVLPAGVSEYGGRVPVQSIK